MQHWDHLPVHLRPSEIYVVFLAIHADRGMTVDPGIDTPPRGQGAPLVSGAWSIDPQKIVEIPSNMVQWETVEAKRLMRAAPRENPDYKPKRSLGYRDDPDHIDYKI